MPDIGGAGSISYPYSKGKLHVRPDVDFTLAIGNPASVIAAADLARMKAHGVKVDSSLCLAWVKMLDGRSYLATRRYLINSPATGGNPPIKDVVLYPARPGDPSILGADFIEHFAMEYHKGDPARIIFHRNPPARYQKLTDLIEERGLASLLGQGHSYYVKALVGSEEKRLKVETGIYDTHVRMPASDTILVNAPLRKRLMYTAFDSVMLPCAEAMWVKLGDRSGYHPVYYGQWREAAPLSINLLNFYDQNVLIDFPNNAVGLLPNADDSATASPAASQASGQGE